MKLSEYSSKSHPFKQAIEGPEKKLWWSAICKEIGEDLDRRTFNFIHRTEANNRHMIDVK